MGLRFAFFCSFPASLEDKVSGKEEQYKTLLNLRYLIAQISSRVDISCDVVQHSRRS